MNQRIFSKTQLIVDKVRGAKDTLPISKKKKKENQYETMHFKEQQ